MRFEKLVWTVLAMFLVGSGGWNERSLVGGVGDGRGGYQAADGGTEIPPPPPNP